MPAPQIQDLFTQQRVNLANTTRLEGDFRYAIAKCDWIGYGVNASKGTGQTTRITFAAPGELPAGGRVYLTIERNVGGVIYPSQIELKNTGTTAINLAQSLADRINGTSTVNPVAELVGYTAQVVTASPTVAVNITSNPGESFDIETGNFGVIENGVTNPAAPAIVTNVAASSGAPIPFGRAVVTNLTGNSTAYGNTDGVVALEADRIVSLPTASTTERFAGWSYRPGATFITPVLSDRGLESYPSGEAVLYVRNEPLHGQQVLLKLEQLPPGATVPSSLVGQPLYYRRAASGGYFDLGAASILGSADTNRALAADETTARQWIVAEVADAATNLVWAALRGY